MSTQPNQLGPYTAGEIPEPLVVAFEDSSGGVLTLAGYDARWVIELVGHPPVTNTATVTSPSAGEVTYTWVDGDLAVSGKYLAEMWVGNGTNRFASIRFKFKVVDALAIPSI